MKYFTERNDEFYKEVANMAMELFNSQMDTGFSEDTVEVCLFTEENADEKIPAFLENYKDVVEPVMLIPGYSSTISAEAFVTKERLGILIRTDLGIHDMQWRHTVLHELSHIFCTLNELKSGEKFFDKYCVGFAESTIQDGAINAGYAVWREFIAEFLATLLDKDMMGTSLEQMFDHCNHMIDEMEAMVEDDKYCLSAMLIDLMTSQEILQAVDFEQALAEMKAYTRVLESRSLLRIVQIVFEQVSNEEFWLIDLDFIESVGNAFLSYKTENYLKSI